MLRPSALTKLALVKEDELQLVALYQVVERVRAVKPVVFVQLEAPTHRLSLRGGGRAVAVVRGWVGVRACVCVFSSGLLSA
jgi:hypothetical protein